MAQNQLKPIPLTSINATTFDGTYKVINTNGLDKACSIIRIINDSAVDVTVSYDGSTDHDYIPTAKELQLPAQANAQPNNYASLMPLGTKIYVKAATSTGLVYLAGYYNN